MNKFFISATVVIICGILIGVSLFKVITEHNQKVLLVESKYIIESSKKCINEKKCSEYPITLKQLYEQDIITRQVNEVTKEYYNEESYVTKDNDNYDFIIVN
jgi:hypothetical protein